MGHMCRTLKLFLITGGAMIGLYLWTALTLHIRLDSSTKTSDKFLDQERRSEPLDRQEQEQEQGIGSDKQKQEQEEEEREKQKQWQQQQIQHHRQQEHQRKQQEPHQEQNQQQQQKPVYSQLHQQTQQEQHQHLQHQQQQRLRTYLQPHQPQQTNQRSRRPRDEPLTSSEWPAGGLEVKDEDSMTVTEVEVSRTSEVIDAGGTQAEKNVTQRLPAYIETIFEDDAVNPPLDVCEDFSMFDIERQEDQYDNSSHRNPNNSAKKDHLRSKNGPIRGRTKVDSTYHATGSEYALLQGCGKKTAKVYGGNAIGFQRLSDHFLFSAYLDDRLHRRGSSRDNQKEPLPQRRQQQPQQWQQQEPQQQSKGQQPQQLQQRQEQQLQAPDTDNGHKQLENLTQKQQVIRIMALLKKRTDSTFPSVSALKCHIPFGTTPPPPPLLTPPNSNNSRTGNSGVEYQNTELIYWLSEHTVPSPVELYEMCENHDKRYGGWILSCPIPKQINGLSLRPCSIFVSLSNASSSVFSDREAGGKQEKRAFLSTVVVELPVFRTNPVEMKTYSSDVVVNRNNVSTGSVERDDARNDAGHDTSHDNDDNAAATPDSRFDPDQPSVRPRERPQGGPQGGPQGRTSLCVPPLFGRIDARTLIDFIELTLLLGADHMTMYVPTPVPQSIDPVLRHYIRLGVLTTVQWNVPVPEKDVWYNAQLLAVNDCVYRGMHIFDLLVFNDLDEFIVPSRGVKVAGRASALTSWKEMLKEVDNWVEKQYHSDKSLSFSGNSTSEHSAVSEPSLPGGLSVAGPRKPSGVNVSPGPSGSSPSAPGTLPPCAYSFKSAFFEPMTSDSDYGDVTTSPKDHAVAYELESTLRTRMYSAVRMKVMVRPRAIFEMGIHHVSRMIDDGRGGEEGKEGGAKESEDEVGVCDPKLGVVNVRPMDGYVHHYRHCLMDFDLRMDCEDLCQDETISRYIPEMRLNVRRTLRGVATMH